MQQGLFFASTCVRKLFKLAKLHPCNKTHTVNEKHGIRDVWRDAEFRSPEVHNNNLSDKRLYECNMMEGS